MAHFLGCFFCGVQGVECSNHSVPTNKIKGLALTKG